MAFVIVDVDLIVDPERRRRRQRTTSSPPSTLDVDAPVLRASTERDNGRGRGRRWGQTSTYRFAAVKLNAGVKVDVIVDVIVDVRRCRRRVPREPPPTRNS